ncbi:hypothetical protein CWI38_2498p0020 [Hamiltosporidium tvaerminnensis]|uniref:Transcription factor CBF/NF-Y/archaeal histone domain-containing protein n=2 Tax=Hamiltosporidium TaxID=1176354 RepID=A0A4Q9L8V6_9MICR|nr:hypothetical protein CWI36_0804p0020 [Hamiltosporidium magnivora]TBU06840.1 hypothetical protein CWI38_2498p0020 [Hamiltosporidium tvaerminnensis]
MSENSEKINQGGTENQQENTNEINLNIENDLNKETALKNIINQLKSNEGLPSLKKIKKLIKENHDITKISDNSVDLIFNASKSIFLFLVVKSIEESQKKKRKTLMIEDIKTVIKKYKINFLTEMLQMNKK